MNASIEPIAIVGIGCRFPGGGDDPESLWQRLLDRFDAIGPIPADRFDADSYYDPRPATPGRIMSERGGFVTGIDQLDADFFHIAPREAERLDPQQRLLLETTWEALEDAGVPAARVAGSNTGVYVGMWTNEFETRMFADRDQIDFHMTTGSGRYAASGRLSYFLDSLGPSITIDTACSSSLVAVHLACQALRNHECDLTLAGGTNVILDPTITIAYSQLRMMAPDGHCKFGDALADGYVRSEGAGMVALKRASDAVVDGDRIYALIKASAVTNDGGSSGLLARPGVAGQEEVLRLAYRRAGVDPATVQYVEAHGTGTAAGDPVELAALGAVVGAGRPADGPCLVGSIKSNIGHSEGAAGVAGLVKLALALHHGEIPPSLHVHEPNPKVPFAELGLRVCTERTPLDDGAGPILAGVTAFGIAGTNAHAVLESAPPSAPASAVGPVGTVGAQLLPVSARSADALTALASSYADLVEAHDGPPSELCASAALRRSHLEHRLAVVGESNADLAAALRAFAQSADHPGVTSGVIDAARARVVFVFPGQGSQWVGMARELLGAEPAFRAAMERCDEAIRAESGWSPLEVLADDDGGRLEEIDVIQPLLFAIEVALAELWASWGVEPDAVVGHSMGEVAAAHVAGALSLQDAAMVICLRSRLLRRISGEGAMAVVDLPRDELSAALAGREHELSIAASNSPRSTVVAGVSSAVDAVLAELQAADVFCRLVKVDVASHSPQVEPLLDELRSGLDQLAPQPTRRAFHSTVDAGEVSGETLGPAYWVRNLRHPVLFSDAIDGLADGSPTVFVEISPHPILLPAIEQAAGANGVVTVASMRREQPERATMLWALGTLYCAGASIDWAAVNGGQGRHVDLPTYPWQRERFWYEPRRRPSDVGGHPLLGNAVRPAAMPGTAYWQTQLSRSGFDLVAGHVVRGEAIMPASGFVELARAAADETGVDPVAISNLELLETLPVDPDEDRALQVVLEPRAGESKEFWVHSRASAGDGEWRLHAHGEVGPSAPRPGVRDLAAIAARCEVVHDRASHDASMRARGLTYSGAFQTVVECRIGDGEALAHLRVPDGTVEPSAGRIPIVDGCLQVAIATVPASLGDHTYLPVRFGRLDTISAGLDRDDVWAHVEIVSPGGPADDSVLRCDIALLDADGAVIATMRAVELVPVGDSDPTAELLYDLRWRPVERSEGRDAATVDGGWIVYSGEVIGDDVTERLRAAGEECISVVSGSSFREIADGYLSADPRSSTDHRSVLRYALDQWDGRCRGIVYAWAAGIAADGDDAIDDAVTLGCIAPIALVQALGAELDSAEAEPRLWLLTRGAQCVRPGDRIAAPQAVLWGLGRVVANEQPSLRSTLLDADLAVDDSAAVVDELLAGADDRQLALRDRSRLAPVLQHLVAPERPAARQITSDSYRLVPTVPGSLDSLRLQTVPRGTPAAGEIEVAVTAAALNFLDVLKAMGVCPGFEPIPDVALGAECAGTVVAIGDGVEGCAVGDEVVVLTSSYGRTSTLASHVTVPAEFAVPRPERMTPAEAGALPVAYLTAYYGLVELARVRTGERVLVHAATGGVGLAAIEVCRHFGAEVFATAGSDAKRQYLRDMGIEHVYDSRSTAFAAAVMDDTAGRGVDIVLNSLVGEAIPAGLSVLAPAGRFVEIGKRDVYGGSRLGLDQLKHNISFFVVDLAGLTEQDPATVGRLYHELMHVVEKERLAALPVTITPITEAADAFRTMASAGHIGKLVITVPDEPVPADAPVVRPDSTYLVTGGLGALGLAVAERFVALGARHLALLARSAPGAEVEAVLDQLRSQGTTVSVLRADVADRAALAEALASMRRSMPPLRGVVHAAGTLADATVGQMDEERLRAALAPKLVGGWNLHVTTLEDPLDFFVSFSSVAGVLGLSGQGNYAAGNAFLDALAHARRAAGRPAQSIDWGPWADVGLAAAADNRGARLDERGMRSLAPAEGLALLERLLDEDPPQVAAVRLDAARWKESNSSSELLDELVADEPAAAADRVGLRDRLLAAAVGPRRRAVLEEAVRQQLAPVLRVSPDRVDRDRTLEAMGVDSLMALEFRNRLESESGVKLSATLAFNYPTVAAVAEHLGSRMQIPLDQVDGADDPGADEETEPAEDLDDSLTRDDIEAMLAEELAAADRLLETDGRTTS